MKQPKRILAVGGGSGGHISPVTAVTEELLKADSTLEIRFWCDHKTYSVAKKLFNQQPVVVQRVMAGKLRRYNHFSWWQHLRPSILLPNIIDAFKVAIGLVQSFIKLIIWRPDVIFIKGGFVGLPVGLAARVLRIKIIIHDSDTVAGLTNRILSRFATKIATGYPAKYYNYDSSRLVYTGVPVNNRYQTTTKNPQELKKQLGLPADRPVILVTGGGLGSRILNQTSLELAKRFSDHQIVLLSGDLDYNRTVKSAQGVDNLTIKAFIDNLYDYVAVSELVVSRAGATILAELALTGALAIIVPNHRLVGGHQVANAQVLAEAGAAIVVSEKVITDQQIGLVAAVGEELSKSQHDRETQRKAIRHFAKPDAASELADLIRREINA